MTRPTGRFTAGVIAVCLAFASAASGCSSTDPSDPLDASPEPVTQASLGGLTFTLLHDGGLDDGTERSLGDYFGRPLVVNFFAAWCAPCQREMPEFEAVHQQLGDEVGFLGLSIDEQPDAAVELVSKTGVTYPTGWDPRLEVYKATESLGMPTTAFFDHNGALVEVFSGALNAEGLQERINKITP